MNMTTEQGKTLTIIWLDETEPGQLHCCYGRDGQPQDVEVDLDIEGHTLTISYDPFLPGNQSMATRDGLLNSYRLDFTPTAAGANKLLRELAPAAQKALTGSTVEFSNGNLIGRFTPDALDELEGMINAYNEHLYATIPQVQVHDAALLCENDIAGELEALEIEVDTSTSDEQLGEIEAQLLDAAQELAEREGDHVIVEGYMDMLMAHREELQDAKLDELADLVDQIDALKHERTEMVRAIAAEGWATYAQISRHARKSTGWISGKVKGS